MLKLLEDLVLLFLVYQPRDIVNPETLKYWVGVQQGQSYLMERRCLFSLDWRPF